NRHEFRKLEGLVSENEVIGDVPDSVVIEQNGLKFAVPIKTGQKTGFFFDQRENRDFLKHFFSGRKVLDLYCYHGAFALCAAASGAKAVWGVDSSASAVEMAVKNAALNGLEDKAVFHRDNAEEVLAGLKAGETPESPDFTILDPPNLVRNRKTMPQARKLYVKLNQAAVSVLPKGGLLATSSCSHHVTRETFVDILREASARAGRRTILVELRGQASDHPVLMSMPETEYLHFALIRVV
ncbi:MAG: class I SAM-dependent methyltransferase, partial [bacterium]